ncbi:uncharacterized protein F5Z01DRAFT_680329 [Emericellopsis atlantica]|uniref:AttH domain-containing protein n=1 Tax=Emericellopsis atlantica TaxID=2614577 RepID=A0A9P7ZQB8_9HYPO|nr:uncharacterized protein F5Z01DRAFT_680329 [Emericellopsis atlantica]KAG9256374.1 hypothetical protein F5Z01DRAFT_680329 [Emericellopsis atlantica]
MGRFAKLTTFASLLATMLGAAHQKKYVFKPEHEATYQNTGSSWWISSFITGTEGRQYLAISHIMTPQKGVLEYWVDLTYCPKDSKASDTSVPLDGDFDTYGFVSTADDSIAQMRTYANTNASFSLDISWEDTSKPVLNGGSGSIGFGPGPSNATEWGIPAAKTTGSLTLDGLHVEIDTKNSFTWYDRQISYGAPRNWTWFELNFPGTEIKASIWSEDRGPLEDNTIYNFATVRIGESQHVLAYDLIPDMSDTWVSPKSGLVYPLSWRLEFENGDYLVREEVIQKELDILEQGMDWIVRIAASGLPSRRGGYMGA